jgi:ribosome biogenesis SPOUT family RNA methylase Rps3
LTRYFIGQDEIVVLDLEAEAEVSQDEIEEDVEGIIEDTNIN